ncbi:transforming acidic coiled-coil-containing protein 1-like [Conger conger]|uniref:transforming acidic coiled-coil-containing protein 1-like n=1 Tax=Conger conger TaxID=82655 RepID=UPI002A5A5EEC|nr:transforming acidic coiled-coil-containing protein 1-like [Conger conger]
MSWALLSPVQWAKWTWSAVRGGGEEQEEEMKEEEEEGETKVEEELCREEDRQFPRSGSSDSEGNFGTPEVHTPISAPAKELVELEDPNANGTAGLPEEDSQLISDTGGLHDFLDQNSNRNEVHPPAPLANASGEDTVEQEVHFDELNNLRDVHLLQMVPPHVHKSTGDALVVPEGATEPLKEQLCNGHAEEAQPKAIPEKVRPSPLNMRGALNRANSKKAEATSEDDIEIPVPKAGYGFNPDWYDDNFNPFSSGGSKLQNSPPPCRYPTGTRENLVPAPQYSPTGWVDSPAAQDDPVTTREYSSTTRKYSTAAREDSIVVQDDPITTWEDPTTTQEYSTTTREYSATTQENPTAIRQVPTAIQGDSFATLEDPTTSVEDPTSTCEVPTANQTDPALAPEYRTTAREVLTATQEDPPATLEDPTAARVDAASTREDPATREAKPIKMEFGLTEEGTGGEPKKPPLRKLGKKPASKLLAPRKHKPKPAEPAPAPAATHSSEDAPVAKTSHSSNASEWDDPNFNPFGSKAKMSSSPTLPKGSYSFDPDRFDDSVDPFKPSKSLGEANTLKVAPPAEKLADEPAKHKLELPLEDEERKGGQSPKKSKSRMITTTEQVKFLCFLLNACKVEKYENQSLVLDVCDQEEDAVVTQAPSTSHRVSRATDEEKLASTAKGESENEALERHAPPASPPAKTRPRSEESQMKTADSFEEKDSCSLSEEPPGTKSTEPRTGSEAGEKGSPALDSICISEADKGAVLTLIREEIIAKEIEASQWKRKFEQSRQEVVEMRKIVAEYENTVAQMIEDEHRTNRTSQRTVQQLTTERDQALADLNSVERSISDLFRRYENMKSVLEGFKKNEEVLKKCAQEYLQRVKQEEQRYQTLKLHAEEKLDSANEEIALVRSKANSESIALNASLRKEQMKVESLEQALHQKNQEMEELTKICDELIAKLGKTD